MKRGAALMVALAGFGIMGGHGWVVFSMALVFFGVIALGIVLGLLALKWVLR